MGEKAKNREAAVSAFLCGVLALSAAYPSFAEEASTWTVTVAVTGCPNFLQLDENGEAVGYAKDYLDEVAGYTGWNFEYQEMSFPDALSALQNGDVDLVPGLQKSASREALFDFSTYDMGETHQLRAAASGVEQADETG